VDIERAQCSFGCIDGGHSGSQTERPEIEPMQRAIGRYRQPSQAEMGKPPGSLDGYDADLFDRLVELEDHSFWFRARNKLIVQLVRQVTEPGDSVLEVGCGTGYVLRALVYECGLVATGTDLFADALTHARHRVPNAILTQWDARTMTYDRAFQLVGAFDVIEHVDDDIAVLTGLYRAARPGGFLLVTVPQHPWLWSRADVQAAHKRRYRRGELIARVEQAGFTVLRASSFVTTLLPFMAASRWSERFSSRRRDPISDLTPGPAIDFIFKSALSLERAAIVRGIDLPVGGTLVVLGRRGR
jgi:SAM-dependent methyltransferase